MHFIAQDLTPVTSTTDILAITFITTTGILAFALIGVCCIKRKSKTEGNVLTDDLNLDTVAVGGDPTSGM